MTAKTKSLLYRSSAEQTLRKEKTKEHDSKVDN